ncbi:MAG: CinA family protein [Eubacterium sp.]|nr:CinA family protein [Eubacterium sp.]
MFTEENVRKRYEKITLSLIENGLTITTMESCTAGQIASLITDTEGSSAVLKGAFITYSNEAKVMQGVPAGVIAAHGVYSMETAEAMALAALAAYGADIAVGVTGTAGNADEANSDSVPGRVFYAVAASGHNAAGGRIAGRHGYGDSQNADGEPAVVSRTADIPATGGRLEYKLRVADIVAEEIEGVLKER